MPRSAPLLFAGPEAVTVSGLSGDVRGKAPIIVDDMISTGGTIEAAVWAVASAGADLDHVIIGATHALFVVAGVNRLRRLNVGRLFVTDSVAPGPLTGLPVEIVGSPGRLVPFSGARLRRGLMFERRVPERRGREQMSGRRITEPRWAGRGGRA